MSQDTSRISWSKGRRPKRLLDWLDAHPLESSVLFTPSMCTGRSKRQRTLTKQICGERAAAAILAVDEDINLQRRAAANPRHYGVLLNNHLSKLRLKYQKFNNCIGRNAAIMEHKDIQDKWVLEEIETLMEKELPEWSRLHRHWRTIQHYNQHWKAPEKNAPTHVPKLASTDLVQDHVSRGKTRIRRPTFKVEAAGWANIYRRSPKSGAIIIDEDSPPPEDRSIEQSASTANPEIKTQATISPLDFDLVAQRDTKNDRKEDGSLTEAKRLELQIEIKKLDIQRAQMDAEARREKEQHEIRMKLTAFVTENLNRGANGA